MESQRGSASPVAEPDTALPTPIVMTTRRFTVFAWTVLGYALLVILWGYFLRVSESGDGCGTDWPLCEGAFVPSTAGFPTWVEFIHRASSGLVLVLVVAMAVWAFRSLPRGHAVRWAASASLVLTVTESLFGAVLVRFGWVASDVSAARILIRPLHVTNNFLLMAALGLTAWWAHRGMSRRGAPRSVLAIASGLGILALAATGSWTGLAGTAFPAESVVEGLGQYLTPEHLLIYLRTVHPLMALAVVVLLGRFLAGRWRATTDVAERRLVIAIVALAGTQVLVGPLTILLLHPVALRLAHLLLGDLLWLCFVFLVAIGLEDPGATPARSYSPRPDSERTRRGAARP